MGSRDNGKLHIVFKAIFTFMFNLTIVGQVNNRQMGLIGFEGGKSFSKQLQNSPWHLSLTYLVSVK